MFKPETEILVVDDMMVMRKIVVRALKEFGLSKVIEADDGSTAWAKLQDIFNAGNKIDLIISDWNMPQMKGIDLLKKCRAHATYKDIAFLMVTAEAEANQVKEALVAGVDNYVVKPFTPAAFEEKIKSVAAKRFPGK